MRNTKVYSITMPPDLAKQAERLAKKENRTMSELMREALRRYQHPQVFFDPTQFIGSTDYLVETGARSSPPQWK